MVLQRKCSQGCTGHIVNVLVLYFQLRAELCVPQRMKVMEKAILERDFKTFAETTMKVSFAFIFLSFSPIL